MIRGNALYEGIYLLGTSIARPLIAKRQIEIAKKFKAQAVSHGSTGKGNDQVRFELGYYYFGPKIKVIAPWRDWNFSSRSDLIKYAEKNNIPVPHDKKGAPPFSVDDNLYHTSTEARRSAGVRRRTTAFPSGRSSGRAEFGSRCASDMPLSYQFEPGGSGDYFVRPAETIAEWPRGACRVTAECRSSICRDARSPGRVQCRRWCVDPRNREPR